MNNIFKIAAITLNRSDNADVIKTAGILRMLKNKILSMFDSEQARETADLLKTTTSIKPLLSETFQLIKKVESAINDLDIADYNANIDQLKMKISDLNEKIQTLDTQTQKAQEESLKENEEVIVPEPKSDLEKEIGKVVAPETKSESEAISKDKDKDSKSIINKKRRRADLPEGKSIYDGVETLSELGVTAADIKPNLAPITPITASWASENRSKLTDESIQDLLKDQDKLTIDNLIKTFYDKIPSMKIDVKSIKGRELQDDETKGIVGEKKPGYLELRIVSDLETLQPPLDNWKFKMVFYLVDKREKVDDPLKYIMYRKFIVAAYDKNNDKTILISKNNE